VIKAEKDLLTKLWLLLLHTDEMPGFLLLLKNDIVTARSEDTIFIFHV